MRNIDKIFNGLAYQIQSPNKNLTQIHYIPFTQYQLCTRLVTDRVYVDWDIIFNVASKITVFSYLYDDVGNSTSQNMQVTGLCVIMYSVEATGCFLIEVTLFCLTVLLVCLRRYWMFTDTKYQFTGRKSLRVTFHNNSDAQLVLFYCWMADVPVLTYRSNILTVFYCVFPQRLHDAYRDITWQLIKNIPSHILPNSSHHIALFPVSYWQ
jgi:hypothetical protein